MYHTFWYMYLCTTRIFNNDSTPMCKYCYCQQKIFNIYECVPYRRATLVPAVNNRSMHFRPSHCIICALNYPLDYDKTRSKMMVQFESQRPPIFKVQWVKKGATHLILCISMAYNVISCQKFPRKSPTTKITDFLNTIRALLMIQKCKFTYLNT